MSNSIVTAFYQLFFLLLNEVAYSAAGLQELLFSSCCQLWPWSSLPANFIKDVYYNFQPPQDQFALRVCHMVNLLVEHSKLISWYEHCSSKSQCYIPS